MTVLSLLPMAAMHEQVQQRTSQEQYVRKNAEQVCAMFGKQEEADDHEESQQHDASA
jgi:hypothetical protein